LTVAACLVLTKKSCSAGAASNNAALFIDATHKPWLMDDIDRAIINKLQTGFPICAAPYQQVAVN